MTEWKHTKGPWVVGNRYTASGVFGPIGELVAGTHGSMRTYDRDQQIVEQNANARLIAASPEMLPFVEMVAALKIADMEPDHFVVAGGVNSITAGDVRRARALLAKIKGGKDAQ